ncbi:hypothetical protein [Aquisediminimonas sediminicola]|uniref:hypothetical protein n=1 Tax=Alteraquisediminimonas sediminicola TaxID=2676787 RepID=UPI001C8EA62E|nr:hypothetical protein [Aquisediminimonas sediminicola]
MTKEEQIALDAWREADAWKCARGTYYADEAERISAQHEAYRELVVNDVRPPVVDRENVVFQNAFTPDDIDEGVAVIRTYGDERCAEGKAEGERAGIERAITWYRQSFATSTIADMRRDLLGEQQ